MDGWCIYWACLCIFHMSDKSLLTEWRFDGRSLGRELDALLFMSKI